MTAASPSAGRFSTHNSCPSRARSGVRTLRPVVLTAAVAGTVAVAVAAVAVRWLRRLTVVDVSGTSMEPTLTAGDRYLALRRPAPRRLRRDQLVVLEAPYQGEHDRPWQAAPARRATAGRRWLVKRLVALPGDRVPANGHGRLLPGSVVPAERYVVLGDNPGESYDSRHFGYLPSDRLLAVLLRRIGPSRPNQDRPGR